MRAHILSRVAIEIHVRAQTCTTRGPQTSNRVQCVKNCSKMLLKALEIMKRQEAFHYL